ncbi:ABC transporter permease [Bacillus sp. FSL K6-3431]|uniref:ABC transporter permease n=1 Tax=Bacillus sp. FSL K6-3431 TaxID=2921500 RepID=UPI0030F5C09D
MRIFLSFIKKELLLFVRNPQELLVLLGMPLLLITILGFALGSVLDGDQQPVKGKVALILHTSEAEDFADFKEKIAEMPLPDEARDHLYEQTESLLPITMLKKEIFGQKELQSIIMLEEQPVSQLQEIKNDGRYSAIIEVPAHFTIQMLESLFMEEKVVPALTVYSNEGKELSAAIVEDIVAIFQERYSVWGALGREGLLGDEIPVMTADVDGAVETLTKKEISAFSYYAVGMSVMFVLFIASSVSSLSFMEKKWNVFDRILLANVPRWSYVASVFFSAKVIAFLQLMILYAGSAVFYGVRWPNIAGFLCVTLSLCSAVGGIAVLLMAINSRLNSEAASKLFMSGFVAVIAFIGGSFTPVGNMSEWMEKIGQLTPNGAAMSAYLELLRGGTIASVADRILVLLLLAGVLSVVTWLIFPRKGGAV